MLDKPLISHIGIAVNDLEAAINKYKILTGDYNPLIEEVSDQNIKAAIFKTNNSIEGGRVELVTPLSELSPISKYLRNKGEGLHHICIYVDDINAKLTELKEAGFSLIDKTPRIGAEGKKIAFIHPKDSHGVLIELEEK